MRQEMAVGCLLLLAGVAPAGEAAHAPVLTLSATTGYLQMDYTEHDRYHQTRVGYLDTENGRLPLLRLEGLLQQHIGALPVFAQASWSYAYGLTDYNGHYQISLKPTQQLTQNELIDVLLRAGLTVPASAVLRWSPFLEIGAHQWLRGVSTDGEDYRHLLLGGGVRGEWQLDPVWRLEAAVAIDAMLQSELRAQGVILRMSPAPVYTADLGVSYAATPRVRVRAAVSYQQFDYGESPAAVVGQGAGQLRIYEPDSSSRLTQLTVGLAVGF